MEGNEEIEFKPNLMVIGDYCQACAAAKKLYADEIKSGEIKVVSIDDALDEQKAIPGLVDCLYEKDQVGIPIFAEIKEGKVVACRIGVLPKRKPVPEGQFDPTRS